MRKSFINTGGRVISKIIKPSPQSTNKKDILMPQPDNLWWEIIVEDPEFLSGESVCAMLPIAIDYFKAHYVVVIGEKGLIECFSTPNTTLCHRIVLSADELIRLLPAIVQVDWGDFYFCTKESECTVITLEMPIDVSIGKSVFTARAVDNGWMYFYTQDILLKDILVVQYGNVTYQHGRLEDFTYPY